MWLSVFATNQAPDGFGDASQVDELNIQGTSQLQLDSGGDGKFLDIVKWAINWVLGVLALIGLIMVIIGGLMMVTAAGDEEQYKKWFMYLKAAAIGIVIIGVAWFIASMFFWLASILGTSAEQSASPGSNS